jgi:hypothetical protein
MCFQRTFALIEDIELALKRGIPFQMYGRGCHLISDAAQQILQKMGYEASIELVGFRKAAGPLIPHYISSPLIVRWNGMIVDLKQRVFGTSRSTTDELPPIRPRLQSDGFYCDGREFVHNPTARIRDHEP